MDEFILYDAKNTHAQMIFGSKSLGKDTSDVIQDG